ncbi:MAG: hypothetical protein ACPGVU_03320 [Limisphaerales bacterium]
MNAGTIFKFQFGNREAIEKVARSRASIWTGIILVLITTIPRNYDQIFITENPLKWTFGSLLFSIVSGTCIFIVAYQVGTWRSENKNRQEKESSNWRCFMGMFWMTAPTAWLYAIPVERWLDPVSAASANLTLLAVVSTWRVWLITRCLSVVCGIHFSRVLPWVLVTASAEVVVVSLFGVIAGRVLLTGMSGMRNSPAEDVLAHGLSFAFENAALTFPIAAVLGFTWGWRGPAQSLPESEPGKVPFVSLSILAAIWVPIAIHPQTEVRNVVEYERRLKAGNHRAALDWLNHFPDSQLAPSRDLPPKAFERSVFEELPPVIGELRESAAAWMKTYFLEKLDQMVSHYRSRWRGEDQWLKKDATDRREDLNLNWKFLGPDPIGVHQMLTGLNRFPEGRRWIADNPLLIDVWRSTALTGETFERWPDRPGQRAAWTNVLELIGREHPDTSQATR